jgi:uncharacterized protein (TIGR04255 family)
MFYNSYPNPEDLTLENISLKYINGFSFDYDVLDPVQFVRENLSLGISLPASALGESINKNAVHMNFQVSFNTHLPLGTFTSSWATGELEHRKTLFWQLWLTSLNPATDFHLASDDWLNAVHEVIERWFFSSLSGKLRKELLHE